MSETRIEWDAVGSIEVPAHRLWGSQTQRSLNNFPIGHHPMPRPVIEALALIKRAAALLNEKRGALASSSASAIVAACDEILKGKLWDEFPLSVWQTGSGTHTNMNVNEVIANRAIELLGGIRGTKSPVHPNDHVNMAQSSNDAFSAAIYIAGLREIRARLVPSVARLCQAFATLAHQWQHVAKVGRTHLMDATPMTFGHEAGAWAAQLQAAGSAIEQASLCLAELALGATAVGTGINAPDQWGPDIAAEIATFTGIPFVSSENKFAAISSHDGLVFTMGAITSLASALTKIGNDVRLLSSGPRCGIGELLLPTNEPGSSIMPGKVNPSQAEALLMVCARVAGNNSTAFIGAASGLLQLNVAKPLLALCLLESCDLLVSAMDSFRCRCVEGMEVNLKQVQNHLERTLMTATALAPEIGYDAAAAIAKDALRNDTTLRAAALAANAITPEKFDSLTQGAFIFKQAAQVPK